MSLKAYYDTLRRLKGLRQEKRYRHQMEFIYKDIDFQGKTVLDIGGGTGLHAFFASAKGASNVTLIEPEGDGGHNSMIATFKQLRDAMDINNVDLIQTTVQNFEIPAEAFDIVLVQDAINHFNEPACITLHQSESSRKTYDAIFSSIAALVKPGGILVMSDCSSKNIFPLLGLRNPFDPSIEWEKHQPPSIWADVARPQRLELMQVRWSSPSRLGAFGLAVFSNAIASWFFTSHFVATFTKRV